MGYVHICNKHDWHLELGLFGCPYSPVLQAGLALGTAADRTGRGGLTYTVAGFVQLEVALGKAAIPGAHLQGVPPGRCCPRVALIEAARVPWICS